MGKYIIEIPDDKVQDFVGSTHLLMPYSMAGHIGHHDTGLPITPYTEPDIEQVRKEAYEKGYEDGKQEIKVGDEVVGVFSDGSKTRPFVFIRGSQEYYFGLYSDTGEFCQGGMNMRKTGRHFPEIAAVLEKMRGEQE